MPYLSKHVILFENFKIKVMAMTQKSPFTGFHHLCADERCERLILEGYLTKAQKQLLRLAVDPHLDALCQQFSENVLGGFALPLSVVPSVVINHKNYILPLVVEETSIVAGLCKMAKWIRSDGTITTSQTEQSVMGQVFFMHVADIPSFESSIEANKKNLIDQLNTHVVANMAKRGGGVFDLRVRVLEKTTVVIDVFLQACDAMGANLVTQVAEYLKQVVCELTGQRALMGIVSNYSDRSITSATIEIHGVLPTLGRAIEEASLCAKLDPHRAATHNKGIMNGMDAILIATGNDWRAVEAGCHAYAASDGSYKGLATWCYNDGILKGILKAPIAVGTVGGVTKVHPQAQICLQLLGVQSACELAQVVAATGLLQNLAALHALVSDGIARGHMRLHIDNLLLQCEVMPEHREALKKIGVKFLNEKGHITLTDVKNHYHQWLNQHSKDS
jgi:hydroxymethylglutaryl-CoA reductase